jgi:hypothetical protein
MRLIGEGSFRLRLETTARITFPMSEIATDAGSQWRGRTRLPPVRRWPVTLAIGLALLVASSRIAAAQTCGTQEPPGFTYPLFDWRSIAGGTLPQSYGYVMIEDEIQIDVADGKALGLAPNQMQINLVTSLNWQKQIVAWSNLTGPVWSSSMSTPGAFEGAIVPPDGTWRLSMLLTRIGCGSADTIVLQKAKLFGVLTNMYVFDPNNFWLLWGGKNVTINWLADNAGNQQFPPECTAGCVPVGTLAPGPLADFVAWRPSSGTWFFDAAGGSWFFDVNGVSPTRQWGQPGDVPVRGFYDGDDEPDTAVYRPSTGDWFVINSTDGSMTGRQWGQPGDIPVPADYDGDGRTDFAVWRPSTGTWWIDGTSLGVSSRQWGQAGDIPVPGDYDGDGRTDFAVFRPLMGTWWVINSFLGAQTTLFGRRGDIPVPADYDHDGRVDLAVWRPSTGVWWILNSSTGTVTSYQWGMPGDIPVPGDYDHDGHADLAVWRPSTSTWFVILSSTGQKMAFQFPLGQPGDVPIAPSTKHP